MSSQVSRRALLLGSAASGLIAGIVGPAVLLATALITDGNSKEPVESSFTLEGLGILLMAASFMGVIGVVAAIAAGFPILMALRTANRLGNLTALLAGTVVGLGAALLLWLVDSFEPGIFPTAAVIGGFSGWIAFRIAIRLSRVGKDAGG